MISYFIVAHCMFTTNFSSKRKSQIQINFGQDSFLLKISSFLVSFLQNSTNQWMVEYLLLALLSFYKKVSHLFLQALGFVVKYFSFVEQTVLMVFTVYSFVTTKSPIFFFVCLQMVAFEYFQYYLIFGRSDKIYPMELFVNI